MNHVCEQQCQISPSKQHNKFPLLKGILHEQLTGSEYNDAVFYSSVHTADFILNNKDSDCCIRMNDDTVGLIQHIVQKNDSISVVVRLFDTVSSFYTYPCDSNHINIIMLKNLTRVHRTYMLTDLKYKCMCMPLKDSSFF